LTIKDEEVEREVRLNKEMQEKMNHLDRNFAKDREELARKKRDL
jgi:hypothetical protein